MHRTRLRALPPALATTAFTSTSIAISASTLSLCAPPISATAIAISAATVAISATAVATSAAAISISATAISATAVSHSAAPRTASTVASAAMCDRVGGRMGRVGQQLALERAHLQPYGSYRRRRAGIDRDDRDQPDG